MNKPLPLLLVGVVLVASSIVFRASFPGNAWQIMLGIGILLEIWGGAGMWIEAKKRGDQNAPKP
jgi:hypothetical protein